MTTIKVSDSFIEVSGHSEYGDYGKDIVCAAISTLSEATYNYLISTKNKAHFEENDGYYKIILEELNEQGIAIKNEFIRMVDELEEEYGENIRRIK